MRNLLLVFTMAAMAAFGQYKAEPGGAPPADLPAGIGELLQKDGTKVVDGSGKVLYELWFRSSLPTGPKAAEESVTMPEVPHGTLLGVLRVPAQVIDRRGSPVKPGTYLLRFSYFPQNGAHQGVAPQRDFLVLTRPADDPDAKANPDFGKLMATAMKSGQPHPNVLSFWKQDAEFTPGFAKMGEHDWVLQTKIGDTPVAVILIGQAEA